MCFGAFELHFCFIAEHPRIELSNEEAFQFKIPWYHVSSFWKIIIMEIYSEKKNT